MKPSELVVKTEKSTTGTQEQLKKCNVLNLAQIRLKWVRKTFEHLMGMSVQSGQIWLKQVVNQSELGQVWTNNTQY